MSDRTFSVVIPTLQRASELRATALQCAQHPFVAEVLIVNNSPEPLDFSHPRIRVLQQDSVESRIVV
ncbi:hypothetical protein [Brachybacterium aquaticum]|uniref:Glycosyltransferase 2-like domain-containing protein n=1 Tax=Brachybacterium aquaticum TaxID=1432564 RepID=A0A841AGM0_9MICO|nr:hypothetical protein [Brachybacterium aquaticum]MBB5832741.1 hypothetical protein [Brachybacterium aquaticum]